MNSILISKKGIIVFQLNEQKTIKKGNQNPILPLSHAEKINGLNILSCIVCVPYMYTNIKKKGLSAVLHLDCYNLSWCDVNFLPLSWVRSYASAKVRFFFYYTLHANFFFYKYCVPGKKIYIIWKAFCLARDFSKECKSLFKDTFI